MNFAFTTPHQQTRKYIVFISFLVFSTFFTSYYGNAQIDIKSKVDAQTYADYSKAIDLFEKNINPNEVLTLFIPINYSLDRISSELYNSVFNVNDQNDKLPASKDKLEGHCELAPITKKRDNKLNNIFLNIYLIFYNTINKKYNNSRFNFY